MRLDELYQLGRGLQDLAQTAMSREGTPNVSPAEVVVMRDLIAHAASTISDISSRTGFVHSRVSTAVASLRDRGWVVTSTDETDRRRTVAAVTERVRRGASEARAQGAEPALTELLRDLTPARRTALIASLDELSRAFAEQRTSVQTERLARSDTPVQPHMRSDA